MSSLFLLSAALLVTISPIPAARNNTDSCLPAGIQPADVVSTRTTATGNKGKVITVTVAEKLTELKARCRQHKLVDGKGREIRFYQLIGCWGNPPEDYQEQLERQAKEIARLRKRYRVIEMTCNASGDPSTVS
ncbi:MAG TPA: hypothetical protein VGO56_04780 [Pyrinomonadaceae bacterium]|jgi:hypothetical protein|nr:hypothetical protein [Pyrinomonadaceae bacterium]